jgi:hypothetical protein
MAEGSGDVFHAIDLAWDYFFVLTTNRDVRSAASLSRDASAISTNFFLLPHPQICVIACD